MIQEQSAPARMHLLEWYARHAPRRSARPLLEALAFAAQGEERYILVSDEGVGEPTMEPLVPLSEAPGCVVLYTPSGESFPVPHAPMDPAKLPIYGMVEGVSHLSPLAQRRVWAAFQVALAEIETGLCANAVFLRVYDNRIVARHLTTLTALQAEVASEIQGAATIPVFTIPLAPECVRCFLFLDSPEVALSESPASNQHLLGLDVDVLARAGTPALSSKLARQLHPLLGDLTPAFVSTVLRGVATAARTQDGGHRVVVLPVHLSWLTGDELRFMASSHSASAESRARVQKLLDAYMDDTVRQLLRGHYEAVPQGYARVLAIVPVDPGMRALALKIPLPGSVLN